jgi:hypothetical protein
VTPPDEDDLATPDTPRPETTAAGTTMLYLWGSLALLGVFLVAVPGREAAARTWLWVGLALVVVAVPAFVGALRARRRYLRGDREP